MSCTFKPTVGAAALGHYWALGIGGWIFDRLPCGVGTSRSAWQLWGVLDVVDVLLE